MAVSRKHSMVVVVVVVGGLSASMMMLEAEKGPEGRAIDSLTDRAWYGVAVDSYLANYLGFCLGCSLMRKRKYHFAVSLLIPMAKDKQLVPPFPPPILNQPTSILSIQITCPTKTTSSIPSPVVFIPAT
jgi:hypothetical protein